jgi:hypothetical protein
MTMEHIVRLQSREQYTAALNILDVVPGTFHASGPSSGPTLVLGETQYQALIDAGVIAGNGKEQKGNGTKARHKKANS